MRPDDPSAVAGLIELLRRDERIACWAAEDGLVEAGESAVPRLLGALPALPPPGQSVAMRALGRIGDVRAVPALLQALAQDTEESDDYCIEWFAAEALARIGAPALGPLLALLAGENAHLRRWSAVALGEMGDPRAVEALLEHATDAERDVSDAALIALGQIGDRSAVEPLMRLMESPDRRVRLQAVSALGGCVRGELFAPLVELVQRPNELRLQAMYALRNSAGALALDVLTPYLDDPDPCVRMAVINALGRFGDERALPILETGRPDDHERCGGNEGRTVHSWRGLELERLKRRLHLL